MTTADRFFGQHDGLQPVAHASEGLKLCSMFTKGRRRCQSYACRLAVSGSLCYW